MWAPVRRRPVGAAGGHVVRIAACGADVACVLTERQLVRIRSVRWDGRATASAAARTPWTAPRAHRTARRQPGRPAPRDRPHARQPANPRRRDRAGGAGILGCLPRPARAGVLTRREADRRGRLRERPDLAHRRERSPGAARGAWRAGPAATGRRTARPWRPSAGTARVVVLDMTGRRRVGAVLTEASMPGRRPCGRPARRSWSARSTGRLLFVDPANGTSTRPSNGRTGPRDRQCSRRAVREPARHRRLPRGTGLGISRPVGSSAPSTCPPDPGLSASAPTSRRTASKLRPFAARGPIIFDGHPPGAPAAPAASASCARGRELRQRSRAGPRTDARS